MNNRYFKFVLSAVAFIGVYKVTAQNPLIRDQFTADPSARVFDGKVYVFPSHDIQPPEGEGRKGWFNMADYHVFSSEDLTHWQDHGVIVSQDKVVWADNKAYSMWAPDCIERNGKYYFYFPVSVKDTVAYGKGFAIGVAVADKPEGPYRPEQEPIIGVHGIDPNVFIDTDGEAYLYWSAGNIYGAKLKDNMLELATAPVILKDLPEKGLKEGPYMFERKGMYYLTYPHVADKIERLEYATGNNPLGPFHFAGVIMDESPTGCWTNHHSIINYKDQWYLFYHHNDYSPDFDKNRSIRADSLFFNTDGSIGKVKPTLRGVGISDAYETIQVDRYSEKNSDVTVDFIDVTNTFKGWKAIFHKPGAALWYNSIEFGKKKPGKVSLTVFSEKGGTLEIKTGSGKVIGTVQVKGTNTWQQLTLPLKISVTGVNNVELTLTAGEEVSVDNIVFTK